MSATGCPFRKSHPDVMVVRPGQDWDRDNGTGALYCPTDVLCRCPAGNLGFAAEAGDHWHRRLLRPRRERPRGCTAEKRDELAALHSITSLARASSVGGTSRPSALAILRLIVRLYL